MDDTLALALDGPFNGQYITALTAKAANYALHEWQPDEFAWLHLGWDQEAVEEELAELS